MKTVFELIEANGLTLHGDIEHFATLVREDERDRAMRENAYVAEEREACAKVCEDASGTGKIISCMSAAAAIRARGQA